jgi:hypothetical protein
MAVLFAWNTHWVKAWRAERVKEMVLGCLHQFAATPAEV